MTIDSVCWVAWIFLIVFYHNSKMFWVSLPGSTGGPHRRSQSEVPGFQDSEAHSDPFTDISDTLPQKYATLPRNRNPFEGEHGQLWDRAERKEKKEKVSLLERVTGKKEGRKTSNERRSGSSGDLRSPNPFSGDSQADTNPFSSNYKTRWFPFLFALCYLSKSKHTAQLLSSTPRFIHLTKCL